MDTLNERLNRLTEVLEKAVERSRPPSGSAPTEPKLPNVSPRLRPLTLAIAERLSAPEWDEVDALAARLLLDNLAASLQSCRQVANAASDRLESIDAATDRARRVLKRELVRQHIPPDSTT